MNLKNWRVITEQAISDSKNSNKVAQVVHYSYNDGFYQKTWDENYSGILGLENLVAIIQTNLQAHQTEVDKYYESNSTVQDQKAIAAIPDLPVGEIDLTQLFPDQTTVTLAIK